ncbi:unnamed protein product, partial [Ectocarpus sp. 12 AP-2014]
ALSQLERLWLFGNQLTGHIPKELGALSQLESLWFFDNQLTGEECVNVIFSIVGFQSSLGPHTKRSRCRPQRGRSQHVRWTNAQPAVPVT